MRSRAIRYAIVRCSLGELLLAATTQGVCQLRLGSSRGELEEAVQSEFAFARLEEDHAELRPWIDALLFYLEGRTSDPGIPVDGSVSRFQHRFCDALLAIRRARAGARAA